MEKNNVILSVDGLKKVYRGSAEAALKGISFEIHNGAIFGLLGPNGAGKTTTISILCGLLKANGGEVIIDGLNLKSNLAQIKKIIGVVPQDVALYPTLSARENLMYYGQIYGLHGRDLKERIDYCLDLLGMTRSADRRIDAYSGGMKRRTNLIAGILHKPKILFLDEPTVGIDVQSRNVIIEYLFKLNQENTTIVYTSHYLEEAQQLCSDVAIIDYGEIIARGSPRQLIAQDENAADLEDIFLHLTGRELRD